MNNMIHTISKYTTSNLQPGFGVGKVWVDTTHKTPTGRNTHTQRVWTRPTSQSHNRVHKHTVKQIIINPKNHHTHTPVTNKKPDRYN
jgi:hypothetical protein